ncbi:MAG TPA: efflux RND transporter periplasmic adaptor subunit [Longimicrobiaceae bacterium]|nr:efflux RND transporter periplasmic adaptor subunit [Longimicrobiaceae bacterium]
MQRIRELMRGRLPWVVTGVTALAAAGALAVSRMPGEPSSSAQPRAAGMKEMQGMSGMEGMKMDSDGSVHLTADQMRHFGVTFATAERRTLRSEVRTVGVVTFDETSIVQVAPKFGGFVEKLHVAFTGQRVRAGQPLLEIYSPELVAAEQELLLALRLDRTLGDSARLAEAARKRLQLWDVSDAQIAAIEKSGQVRRTLTLYAPASGVVVDKQVVQGEAVDAGETLYTLADLSHVWVEAELREADAGEVRRGSAATVELNAFPGQPLHGTVEYVYPTLQSEARTLKARIALPNPDGRIKPGMYATVTLDTPSRTALAVPSSAVLNTGERTLVFMDMSGGRLMPMEVATGRVAGGYTEIVSGLKPGTRVVNSAQYLLDSESNLGEVMKSMMGQMGTADMGRMEIDGMGMGGMEMQSDSMQGMDMKGTDMKGMPMPAGKE